MSDRVWPGSGLAAGGRGGRGGLFGDRSVATKILTAVLLAVLVAVVVGVTGLRTLSRTAESARELYSSNLLGGQRTAEMQQALSAMRISARDAALAADAGRKQGAVSSFDDAATAFRTRATGTSRRA